MIRHTVILAANTHTRPTRVFKLYQNFLVLVFYPKALAFFIAD